MFRIFGNLIWTMIYLAIGGLVGYYSFEAGGIVNVLTNIFFFALGILTLAVWQSPPKKKSEEILEDPSLDEQDIDVNAVEDMDLTDKSEAERTLTEESL